MTSLTAELYNPESSLSQWFKSKQSAGANRLINNHNQQMAQTQIIRPTGLIKDFGLLGTAFVYAFRWHLGLLESSFNQTVASFELDSTIAKQLLSAKTSEEKACACLIFAAKEKEYRSGSLPEIATVLMDDNQSQLKPELNYVLAMVEDLANLIESIALVWDKTNSNFAEHKYHLNPTFVGSEYISADGQQIVDGMLIKCFTTLKKYPLTKQHFWQQIAYVLMDWENEYHINKVCWYYSRQKALFIYPIESLFKDLEELRAEWKDFVIENYRDDGEFFDPSFLFGKDY